MYPKGAKEYIKNLVKKQKGENLNQRIALTVDYLNKINYEIIPSERTVRRWFEVEQIPNNYHTNKSSTSQTDDNIINLIKQSLYENNSEATDQQIKEQISNISSESIKLILTNLSIKSPSSSRESEDDKII